MIRRSVVSNPELLRLAALDLRHGIPGDLYYGADASTRAWLSEEHAHQRAAYLREQTDADTARQRAAQRLLARPMRAPGASADQLRQMQTLLLEVSAIAGCLAHALPNITHDQPGGDALALPSQERPS